MFECVSICATGSETTDDPIVSDYTETSDSESDREIDLSDSLSVDKEEALRMEVESEFESELEDAKGLNSLYNKFVCLAQEHQNNFSCCIYQARKGSKKAESRRSFVLVDVSTR